MRAAIFAAFVAFFATAAYADLIATNGKNELRLTNAACTNESILAEIREDYRSQFKAGQAYVNGKTYKACWIDTMQGAYYVVFEDGDSQVYPVSIFIEKHGI